MVHAAYQVSFSFDGASRRPCTAEITFFLEEGDNGKLAPALRSVGSWLLGEMLNEEWGRRSYSNIPGGDKNRREKTTSLEGKTWTELEGKVESLISESVQTLESVKRTYDEQMATMPRNYSRELFI